MKIKNLKYGEKRHHGHLMEFLVRYILICYTCITPVVLPL